MQKAIATKPDLVLRRNRLGAVLSSGEATAREVIAFARYNVWLLDVGASIAKYDELGWGTAEHKALRAILFDQVMIELVARRRYLDVTESAGDIIPGLKARIEACNRNEEQANAEGAQVPSAATLDGLRDDRSGIVTDGANLYEALLGVGRGEEAAKLVDLLVEAFPTGRMYSLLIQHASRLDMNDLARSLAARGQKELGPKGEKMIQRALRKLPPD